MSRKEKREQSKNLNIEKKQQKKQKKIEKKEIKKATKITKKRYKELKNTTAPISNEDLIMMENMEEKIIKQKQKRLKGFVCFELVLVFGLGFIIYDTSSENNHIMSFYEETKFDIELKIDDLKESKEFLKETNKNAKYQDKSQVKINVETETLELEADNQINKNPEVEEEDEKMNKKPELNFDPKKSITENATIYAYSPEGTDLLIKLGNSEKITDSYPGYYDGWNVVAKSNGELIGKNSDYIVYNLEWDGKGSADFNLEEGFVITGNESEEFLNEKLNILGLNSFEIKDFINYWIPKLENNKYNYIRFATLEEINKYMPIEFSTEPDSLIRVYMQYKPLDEKIEVKEQKLETPQRGGLLVVEWAGTEIK